jgi:acyl-CoA synthetase (AMP-forming)/AMP-acid ligase II
MTRAHEVLEQARARQLASLVICADDAGQLVAAIAAAEAANVPIVLARPSISAEERQRLCRMAGATAYLDGPTSQWIACETPVPRPAAAPFTVSLMTSGTTGAPKLARHSLENLLGRIAAAPSAVHGDRRWLLTYLPTGFAGLQVIFTALCLGGGIVEAADRSASGFLHAAARHRATHISGTPTFWRSLLLVAGPGALPGLEQITLGGEAVDQTTLDRLADRFPAARITHIYASSEAGALFSVHDGRAGFPRAWLHREVSGVRLRVRNSVLEVRSPRRMLGYVGGVAPPTSGDGWIITGDLVHVEHDRVCFTGRTDDVINVGGAKVLPQRVEEFLLSCRGVADALVRGIPSPISGAILQADVVMQPEHETESSVHDLLGLCRTRLAAHEAPRSIRIVPRVAAHESGKKAKA